MQRWLEANIVQMSNLALWPADILNYLVITLKLLHEKKNKETDTTKQIKTKRNKIKQSYTLYVLYRYQQVRIV